MLFAREILLKPALILILDSAKSQNLGGNPKNFMLKFPAPQKAYLFGVVCDCFCKSKEESPDY